MKGDNQIQLDSSSVDHKYVYQILWQWFSVWARDVEQPAGTIIPTAWFVLWLNLIIFLVEPHSNGSV